MKRALPRQERGVTMLVVLILLTVMLLGALAMARHMETATVAAGNTAFRDSALQASEVGLNTAYRAVQALPAADENAAAGNWYFPTGLPLDANGLPVVNWQAAATVAVGSNTARYVVERVCSVADVVDPMRECLVRLPTNAVLNSQKDEDDKLDQPNARQYRITVRVEGPRGTVAFIQSLMTKV